METNKSFFFQAFLILVLATVLFLGLKEVLPKKIFPENTLSGKNVVVDSMLIEAFEAESVATNEDLKEENALVVIEPKIDEVQFPRESFLNYKGFQNLSHFYEQLLGLQENPNSKVRIAYFGDSMTDGDMIVEDLRNAFQQKFGGTGIGFVPITSESASSRSSVEHQFSPNWKTLNFVSSKNPWMHFGISGAVSFITDTIQTPWVKYKASKKIFSKSLENATFFYGKSNNQTAKVNFIIGNDTLSKNLATTKTLNSLAIGKGSIKAVKAQFIQADSIPMYGFNFDSKVGIHIDNFSQRGNSGIPLTKLNQGLMQEFNQVFNYDLIVLHYGTNVLNYGTKNYNWYQKSMTKTVNHLKKCFPGVSILIISTADKGAKYELEMKSDSAVVPLTKAQKRYAVATQSGFVNLFTLMGGDGSIVKWTEEEPAMANKDYTHFNFRGAKKVAQILFQEINQGFETYKNLKSKNAIINPKLSGKTFSDSTKSSQ